MFINFFLQFISVIKTFIDTLVGIWSCYFGHDGKRFAQSFHHSWKITSAVGEISLHAETACSHCNEKPSMKPLLVSPTGVIKPTAVWVKNIQLMFNEAYLRLVSGVCQCVCVLLLLPYKGSFPSGFAVMRHAVQPNSCMYEL